MPSLLAPTPTPVYTEPPPEEYSAPPQEQPAPTPVPGTLLSSPSGSTAHPAPQQTAPAQPPPQDSGSATDAAGATTSQIPGVLLSAPRKAVEIAQATPGALSAFTGVGRNEQAEYRPAPAGAVGESAQSSAGAIDAARRASDAELRKLAGGDIGNIGNVLGSVKDVGLAHLAEHKGEVSPERANQVRWTSERLADELAHGDAFYSKSNADPVERASWEAWFSKSSYADWARANPELFQRALTEGYTTPENYVYAPGPDAPWEVFQQPRSGIQRGLTDFAMSPVGTAADIGAMLLTAGGSKLVTESAEQAARLGTRQAGKEALGKGMQVAGRTVDAAATFGLSEAVPAAFRGAEAIYRRVPWAGRPTADAAAQEVANTAQEAGQSILGLRRAADGQIGVPGVPEPSFVANPTGNPNVVRVALPDEGSNPPIDVTYHTDAEGKLVGVYDTALPGPNDRYRALTEQDAQALYDAWARLPNADRQRVRQSVYPAMTRLETAPGEPFIESAAERVFDRRGNPIADTGRTGAGYQREVEDLRRTIMRDSRPDQIVTDFTKSWKDTLYNGMVHPLTRRSLAEHRLQTLRDVLDQLPASYRTPEIEAHYRQMRDLLPREATGMFGGALKWQGPIKGKGGRLTATRPREQAWLREMATLPPKEFRRKALDAGRVGKSNVNLVFDRKPPQNAPTAYLNGYTNYLDIMDFRLKNPPTGRKDLAALKEEVNGLRTSPTPQAQSREDAIKDVLERTGIIPGASALDTDALVIAIENHMRATRPTFPPLPGAVPAPPSGIYPQGSQDELWGMALPDDLRDELDQVVDIGGSSQTAGHRLFTHWQETAIAAEAAKRQVKGIGLDPADARALDVQVNKIATRFPGEYKGLTAAKLAEMPAAEVDRLAAALLKSDVQIAQGVRNASGRMLTPAERKGFVGKIVGGYDKFVAMWRSAVLYNIARGIQYPMLQAAGNAVTGLVVLRSNPRALAMYLNPKDWGRSFAYLRDVETKNVPNAIRKREAVLGGRSHNLARVSRDQLGARTGFNAEDSHPLTRAVGLVLGNQFIKDGADTFDLKWRGAAYEAMFDPAYARLKRDLVPMTEQRFANIAAARGVPLNLSRDQIATAIKSLEGATGGYFNQPQLRQALFEAAGGRGAANEKTLWDAADRVARDYHHEARQLDELANAEVNRLAFAGGDTNLEQALQRGFMFTWWLARATRLYATEVSKSPIQMALWARMIERGNQREKEGASPRTKFFGDFMSTPAGYTVSLNEFSLLGTYLFGTSDDPSDPRSLLTGLGRIFEGGPIGDNLILAAPIRAALYSIGALGQDARAPDWMGVNRLEREIVDALNYANHHLYTFSKTKEGQPDYIPYPGVSQGTINWLAKYLSGQIQGTQQVAGYDPRASQESQIAANAAQVLMEQNPELDPNNPLDAETLRRGVDTAMADHDNPVFQAAQERYLDSLYLGPGSTGEGGWRDVLGAVASHFVLPTQFSRQPTLKVDRNARRGRDQLREDLGSASNLTPDAESTEFDGSLGILGSRTPERRDLELIRDEAAGDPQTRAMRDLYNGLRFQSSGDLLATLDEIGLSSVAVDGYTFTAEQIASLPAEDRRAIAERWVDAAGLRPAMNTYYENRTAQLKADKAYADSEGWDDYAKQYPGGIDRAVDDTAQANPNFQRFIEGDIVRQGKRISLPEMRVTNHEEWVSVVTTSNEAKLAIAGITDSRYGVKADPKYAGIVGGLTEPVGAWLLRETEDRAANSDSEFTKAIRGGYEKFTEISAAMDTLDQQWGRPVGTTRALFVQGTLAGGLDSSSDKSYALPRAEHDALKAMGVNDYFEDNYQLKQYFEWAVQQPAGTDTSIDAYNQSYWSGKNQERVAELAVMFATGQAPVVDPMTGMIANADPLSGLVVSNGVVTPGVRQGPTTIARDTVLAEEPGGRSGIRIAAGNPVMTDRIVRGSDGSTWVYVQVGAGVGGWVDASNLGMAA